MTFPFQRLPPGHCERVPDHAVHFAVVAQMVCLRHWAWLMTLAGARFTTQPTPLAGGMALMTGLLVPTLFACLLLWLQHASPSAGPRAISLPGSSSVSLIVSFTPFDPSVLDANSRFLLRYGLNRRDWS